MLGGLRLMIKQVLPIEEKGTTSVFLNSPGSKRGNRVHVTLTLKGVQNLDEVDPIPGRAM